MSGLRLQTPDRFCPLTDPVRDTAPRPRREEAPSSPRPILAPSPPRACPFSVLAPSSLCRGSVLAPPLPPLACPGSVGGPRSQRRPQGGSQAQTTAKPPPHHRARDPGSPRPPERERPPDSNASTDLQDLAWPWRAWRSRGPHQGPRFRVEDPQNRAHREHEQAFARVATGWCRSPDATPHQGSTPPQASQPPEEGKP